MKNRFRFFAILIALFMCLNMLPFAAFAGDEDNNGGGGDEGGGQTYNVSATANPAAGGTITGSGSVNSGEGATLTAAANEGYTFVNWTESGIVVGNETSITLSNVTSDRTLVANFNLTTPTTYNVSATGNPATGGTITGSSSVNSGEGATLTAAANEGYTFINWTENGVVVGTETSITLSNVTNDRTLVANFNSTIPSAPDTYAITVNTEGEGTASANSISAAAGATVNLTAEPTNGSQFKTWQVSPSSVILANASSATTSFTMIGEAVTVKAIFEKIDYTITAYTAEHGSVSANYTKAHIGDTVIISLEPEQGYELNTLVVKNDSDGTSVSVSNNTFLMPASAVTIIATFKETQVAPVVPVTYSITSGANGYWIKGTGLPYVITVKRSIDDKNCASYFQAVFIDMNVLSPFDYTVRSGSAIVTINASAMQRQTVGTHTITILFKDGFVSTFTYIWADPRYPATGDERQTTTWAALTGVTFVGMAAVVVLGRMYWKKQKNK